MTEQFTVVNSTESGTQSVQVGVPQGSVLGPTDLPSCVASGETYMYADDITVYCVGNNEDITVSLLNRVLAELYE